MCIKFCNFLKKVRYFCKIINASECVFNEYLQLRFQEVSMFTQLTAFLLRYIQVDSRSMVYFHCYHYHLTRVVR